MDSNHHSNLILASGALVIAFTIAFTAGVLGDFSSFFQNTAGVGASVAVQPNPYNTLAQQVTEKERELDQREKEIIVREREVETTRFVETRDQTSLIYTTLVGLLLLALILLNFVLDARRNRNNSS